MERDFVYINFPALVKKLLTPGYLQAVKMFLFTRSILAESQRIQAVTDALLYELRDFAFHADGDPVNIIYKRLTEAEEVDSNQLEAAARIWNVDLSVEKK